MSILGKTPVGIKLSCESVTEDAVYLIADVLKTYHNGRYVIGYDSLYCEKPHYHIHFWSHKEVKQETLKTFKASKLSKQFNLGRCDKIYLGKDLPNADPYHWLGYAVKEKLLKQVGFDTELSVIAAGAGVQLEIKKLKQIKSEELADKDKKKKEFKEKLFEYIGKEWDTFIDTHYDKIKYKLNVACQSPESDEEEEEDKEADLDSKLEIRRDNIYVIRCMVYQYLIDCDKWGSTRKVFIENYTKEYLGKVLKKDVFYLMEHFN